METYEQKKRRLFGKQHFQQYLKELNALTNIEVNSQMLLSIVETDLIGKVKRELFYKTTIDFEDKEELLMLIGKLIKIKSGALLMYTSFVNDCGILRLSDIRDFNINFNFNDEHSGLIKLTLEDLSNELILDFYEEDNSKFLDIEIYGRDWPKAFLDVA